MLKLNQPLTLATERQTALYLYHFYAKKSPDMLGFININAKFLKVIHLLGYKSTGRC